MQVGEYINISIIYQSSKSYFKIKHYITLLCSVTMSVGETLSRFKNDIIQIPLKKKIRVSDITVPIQTIMY